MIVCVHIMLCVCMFVCTIVLSISDFNPETTRREFHMIP